MRFFAALTFAAFAAATGATQEPSVQPVNGCVSFTVGAGTGCAWMCNYCAGALGTNNYYFTTDVCKYEEGAGCVGSPQSGVTYTCCAASEEDSDAASCETESESADEWVEHITEIRITETRRRAV